MKIAIPYEDGQVFQHFGKARQFQIYDIADGKVGFSLTVSPMGGGHGAVASFLRMLGIRAVVCGGIGPGMVEAMSSVGIAVIPGQSGAADAAAADFAAGRLAVGPDGLDEYRVTDLGFGCGHHHGDHGCGGHGDHGCGAH